MAFLTASDPSGSYGGPVEFSAHTTRSTDPGVIVCVSSRCDSKMRWFSF